MMPIFTFSFLLATPYKPPPPPKPKKEKKKKKGKVEQEIPVIEKDYMEYEVKKPSFFCHLEYVLVPNTPAFKVDVVAWNKIARVYYEQNIEAVLMLVVGDLSWVYFKVHHEIEIEDVLAFHQHYVTVTVNPDKKKLGNKAKGDKPKLFFGPKLEESDHRKRLFQRVSEDLEIMKELTDMNGENREDYGETQIQLEVTIEDSDFSFMLQKTISELTQEFHNTEYERVPSSPTMGELPPFKDLTIVIEPSKKGKKKKEKKPKKPKKGQGLQYKISSEVFLSGLPYVTRCMKYRANQLPYCFNIATVKKILTREQAKTFKPLSVTLHHLNCVPAPELANAGIESIELTYDLCKEIGIETGPLEITKELDLDITRTVFTNKLNPIALIECLKSAGLKIDVIGNLPKTERKPKPTLYRNELDNFKHTRPNLTPEPRQKIFLGRAIADISSILIEPYRVLLTYNFKRPVDNLSPKCVKKPGELFQTPINTNEINNAYVTNEEYNESHFLTSAGTVLTLSARLGHPVFDVMREIATLPEVFNRLFIVIYDIQFAVHILQAIQNELEELLTPIDFLVSGTKIKRPYTAYTKLKESNDDNKVNLTGFLIDCVDKIMIYIESSCTGSIQHIWVKVSRMVPSQGRVLYDSSTMFLTQTHSDLSRYGAFYIISLREPPSIILSKAPTYVEGNIPTPAWRALLSLDQLSQCSSIKPACVEQLFPDTKCLLSLDEEFGVPMNMYEKDKPYPDFCVAVKESEYTIENFPTKRSKTEEDVSVKI